MPVIIYKYLYFRKVGRRPCIVSSSWPTWLNLEPPRKHTSGPVCEDVFRERLNRGGKIQLEAGHTTLWARDPDQINGVRMSEKDTKLLVLISLYFWSLEMWGVQAVYSRHHRLMTPQSPHLPYHASHQVWAQTNPSSLSYFCRKFCLWDEEGSNAGCWLH